MNDFPSSKCSMPKTLPQMMQELGKKGVRKLTKYAFSDPFDLLTAQMEKTLPNDEFWIDPDSRGQDGGMNVVANLQLATHHRSVGQRVRTRKVVGS